HREMQTAINVIKEMVDAAGVTGWDWTAPAVDAELEQQLTVLGKADIEKAYQIKDKVERQTALADLRDQLIEKIAANKPDQDELALTQDIKNIFGNLVRQVVRNRILQGLPRIDGRDTQTVRPITIQTGLLPRTHG